MTEVASIPTPDRSSPFVKVEITEGGEVPSGEPAWTLIAEQADGFKFETVAADKDFIEEIAEIFRNEPQRAIAMFFGPA